MRRQLVALALVVLVLSAGCMSGLNDSSGPSDTAPTPPTPSNWSTGSTDRGPTLGTDVFSNRSVGSPDDLPAQYANHYYLIGNNHSSDRTISITIWRNASIVLDRAIEFPADGVLSVEVFRPGEYTLVVDPADAPREVFDAPDEWDCNHRSVEMSVESGGGLRVAVLQTLVECGAEST